MPRLFLNSLALRFSFVPALSNFTSIIQGKMELPNIERKDSSSLLMLKYIAGLSIHTLGLNLSWANRSSLFLT